MISRLLETTADCASSRPTAESKTLKPVHGKFWNHERTRFTRATFGIVKSRTPSTAPIVKHWQRESSHCKFFRFLRDNNKIWIVWSDFRRTPRNGRKAPEILRQYWNMPSLPNYFDQKKSRLSWTLRNPWLHIGEKNKYRGKYTDVNQNQIPIIPKIEFETCNCASTMKQLKKVNCILSRTQ